MSKSKILLVSIRGSYNAAKKFIKKGITDIDYRKTLRDMTVQYWRVSKLAPQIGIVCGVKGNYIFSAFEVNEEHSYDEEIRFNMRKVAFNCDRVRDDLIGIILPEELAFTGGNMIRSIEIEQFYDLVSSQYTDGSVVINRNKVLNEIKADGLTIDNEFGKRQNYHTYIGYGRKEYGNERNQQIKKEALERAHFKCELYDCDRCDFCSMLTNEQRSRIEVHHIDELSANPTNNDNLENLVAICHSLHRRYHYHMTDKERKITKERFFNIRHI